MKPSKFLQRTITGVIIVMLVYCVVYCAPLIWRGAVYQPALVVQRDQGRAKGAGAYFHYRIASSNLQAYIFMPAAFIESRLIWINPKPFLTNPSWADEPQMLILQSPDHNFRFRASKREIPKQ